MICAIQLLCANRHCLLCSLFDESDTTAEQTIATMQDMARRCGIASHCGICSSQDLRYEVQKTKYTSMSVATVEFKKLETLNLQSRDVLDAMGQTFDGQRARRSN